MEKILTVIIPSYKFVSYIESSIDSVFKQKTEFDFDVVVRDDGSKDGTEEILSKLKKKYKNLIVLNGDENLGSYENIKLLLNSTDSKYIAYLDGDDLFGDNNKLQLQVEFLESNPEYVMHFTGCRYLYENNKIHPDDSRLISSVKDIVIIEDLLENNFVGFGRVFRNIKGIMKDYFKDVLNVDWVMSYELSKYGKICYGDFFGGLYRISDAGVYSKMNEGEKVKNFKIAKSLIKRDYLNDKYKTITIIDSFISNNSVLLKLRESIKNLKSYNHKILLVSNTVPPQDVIKSVDYFFYNHENKLFKQKYTDLGLVDLWKSFPQITIHEIHEEFQKHGLSVLCNLFNCLDLAKSLGYNYFQRIEVDDLYSQKGYEFMTTVPSLLTRNNKKSLFYFNKDKDVSFHYFFSEIDFFINNVTRIYNEDSFLEYLKMNEFGMSFKPVEVYLYENLKSNDVNNVLIRNGSDEMNKDFDGTIWNTESSQASISEKYEGCPSKIYRVQDSTNIAVVSYNYNNFPIKRKIVVELENYQDTIYHNLDYFDAWVYNIFDSSVKKIIVYDQNTERLLYELENKNIEDFIELK